MEFALLHTKDTLGGPNRSQKVLTSVDGTKQFAIYDIATRTIGDSTCNQFPAHWTIET